jgi:NAD(P)H-dependent FMN reductase
MTPFLADLPQVQAELFRVPDLAQLRPVAPTTHAPRFLLLYGSLRARSFSRLLTEEAARLLSTMGAEVKIFNPSGLPLPDNAVNQLRVLGRWMRMLTFPNQSSVAKAFLEFDEAGRMKPSAYFDRVVDVMEELVKFTLLTRDIGPYLVDRYSERKESAEELSKRVNQQAT